MLRNNACQAPAPSRRPADEKIARAKIIAGMFKDVNRPQSEKQAEKKREKRRLGWWRTRIGALNKVFGGRFRYGDGKLYRFSDDDSGREDLRILLNHYAQSNPAAMVRIIKVRAPWLVKPISRGMDIQLTEEGDSLLEQVGRRPRYWTSPDLADALGLTEAERTALGGVPTIGAVDVTPDERKTIWLQRNKERRQKKRRADRVQARADYEASSISRAKPWLAEKMSRATWYRRQRETSVDAVNLITQASIPVSTAEPSQPAARTLQEANVVSFVKPNPSPIPAMQAAWKEAA